MEIQLPSRVKTDTQETARTGPDFYCKGLKAGDLVFKLFFSVLIVL